MKMYYIYKITNKNNNKTYIGQSINPEKRLKEHIYGRKNKKIPYFERILRKYGIEEFTFEIIDKSNNRDYIDYLEKKYIKKFNCIKPNGYNILKGGRNQQGAWNSKAIDEYDLDGNYISTYESASYYESFINKEYKASSISRSCKLLTKYKNRQFRFKGDKKPSKYKKGLPNHRTKVYQFDLDGNYINQYVSVTEASKKTNTSRTTIMGCLNGTYKKANNYLWSKSKNINVDEIRPKYIKKTIIYKCDLDKNILEKYYNTREAEIKNNFKYNSYKQILKYLDTNKVYNNYYWYRVNYYKDNIVPSLNKN